MLNVHTVSLFLDFESYFVVEIEACDFLIAHMEKTVAEILSGPLESIYT